MRTCNSGAVALALLMHTGYVFALQIQSFTPSAFMISRQVGQLGFATETEWDYYGQRNPLDPTQPRRTVEASGVSVRLFDARLDDGTRVLLKEFIGEFPKSIGENELEIHELLSQRAAAADQPSRPIGRVLGRMRADSTFTSDAFRAQWEMSLPGTLPPSADGLWLVFLWEPLRTVANFPQYPQPRGWFDFEGRVAAKTRRAFVKAIARRTLEALAWLHGQGVVHRSLGSSSLLLSTFDQTQSPTVTLIDLGFAVTASRLSEADIRAALNRGAAGPLDVIPFCACADDLHALAYLLLELCLRACGEEGGGQGSSPASRPTDIQSLKRLVEDVFSSDVCGGFRSYCADEPEWADAVSLLDEGGQGGWRLLQALVDCRVPKADPSARVTAHGLLESPWFD